jgi:hypothetical protein
MVVVVVVVVVSVVGVMGVKKLSIIRTNERVMNVEQAVYVCVFVSCETKYGMGRAVKMLPVKRAQVLEKRDKTRQEMQLGG